MAAPSNTEMKNRPAVSRAARSVVCPSAHPACKRDNNDLNHAEDIDADHRRQVQ